MAISLVGSGTNSTSWGSSLTFSISSGSITEGDAMLILINVNDNNDQMSSVPSGWTLVEGLDADVPYGYVYKKQAGAAEGNSYQFDLVGNEKWGGAIVVFTGVNTTECFGDEPAGNAETSSGTDLVGESLTIDTVGNVGVHLSTQVNNAVTPPGGTPTYNEIIDVEIEGNVCLAISWAIYGSTGASGTKTATCTGSPRTTTHIELLIAVSIPALEQEGFRWRNDDGSESAATWAQSQDVDDTVAKNINTRLRTLINATNDPDSEQFELQYKRTADGAAEWRKVPEA